MTSTSLVVMPEHVFHAQRMLLTNFHGTWEMSIFSVFRIDANYHQDDLSFIKNDVFQAFSLCWRTLWMSWLQYMVRSTLLPGALGGQIAQDPQWKLQIFGVISDALTIYLRQIGCQTWRKRIIGKVSNTQASFLMQQMLLWQPVSMCNSRILQVFVKMSRSQK